MNPLNQAASYSRDIWDYIADMKYMPSRQDRDALIKQAQSNADKNRRVRLWDYFFRINPHDVGQPHKREIGQLETHLNAARSRYEHDSQRMGQEINGLNNSLARVRGEISNSATQIEENVRQKTLSARARNKLLGTGSLVVAALAFVGTLFIDLFIGGPAFSFCFIPVSLVLAIIGATFLLPLRHDPEVKIKLLTDTRKAAQLARLQTQESDCVNRIAYANDQHQVSTGAFNSYAQQCTTRIKWLHDEINHLVRQIPAPPTDKEVEGWFLEDVDRLRETAINSGGLHDRLIKFPDIPNPICIHAPVELQQEEKIPPPFRAAGTDRNKHMLARKFVVKPDGTLLDFYGVYNFTYLLVAEDLLFTYVTTWDFIMGEQSGDGGEEINYTKITAIRRARGYREIQTDNGKGQMENSPSLTLNLENGQAHVVNFPNLDYLRLTNAPPFDPDKWEFDQTDAVENTIKVISEKKRIAQNLR